MTEHANLLKHCPLCGSERIVYKFIVSENNKVVCACTDCSHMFVNPQPGFAAVPGNSRSFGAENHLPELGAALGAALGRHAGAGRRVAEVGAPMLSASIGGSAAPNSAAIGSAPAAALNGVAHGGLHGGVSLNSAAHDGASPGSAPAASLNGAAPMLSASEIVSLVDFGPEHECAFDACVLSCLLDYSPDPVQTLQNARRLLKAGGPLLFYLPVSDSPDARKHKHKWQGFRSDGLQFFNRATIENALCKSGYEQIEITGAGSDGVIVSCRAGEHKNGRVISIIVPVYNEEKTIGTVLDGILAVPLEGLGKEVIIVESNSADSTRRIVEKYAREHPGIKLILEETPKGKGHAVRAGFAQATGDFIAIQDGDLEYDVNDYAQLVAPLVSYRKAFVLGSRHTESWKIRSFGANKRLTALYMNFGHILFTRLINMGCGARLKDPFTMYKLFRRECLHGLEFEGNRFEIDWEIVIKLTGKGYIPEEIPVNYNSRGYREGKKVSLVVDPLIWIKSFVKYRYF